MPEVEKEQLEPGSGRDNSLGAWYWTSLGRSIGPGISQGDEPRPGPCAFAGVRHADGPALQASSLQWPRQLEEIRGGIDLQTFALAEVFRQPHKLRAPLSISSHRSLRVLVYARIVRFLPLPVYCPWVKEVAGNCSPESPKLSPSGAAIQENTRAFYARAVRRLDGAIPKLGPNRDHKPAQLGGFTLRSWQNEAQRRELGEAGGFEPTAS